MLIRAKSVSDLIIKAWPSLPKKSQVKAKTEDKTKKCSDNYTCISYRRTKQGRKKILAALTSQTSKEDFSYAASVAHEGQA